MQRCLAQSINFTLYWLTVLSTSNIWLLFIRTSVHHLFFTHLELMRWTYTFNDDPILIFTVTIAIVYVRSKSYLNNCRRLLHCEENYNRLSKVLAFIVALSAQYSVTASPLMYIHSYDCCVSINSIPQSADETTSKAPLTLQIEKGSSSVQTLILPSQPWAAWLIATVCIMWTPA